MIERGILVRLGLVAASILALANCRRDPCFADPLHRDCVISDTTEDLWPDPADRTRVHLHYLAGQVRDRFQRTGRLPASLEEMFRGDSRTDPGRSRVDAWHREVGFAVLGGNQFELRSAGPDGAMRTADDIVVTGSALPAG